MKNNIHIVDSYLESKFDFRAVILNEAQLQHAEYVVKNRTMYSLRSEWAVHNLCWNCHLWRNRTKDVDLNYPCKAEWFYKAVGWLALWLIP